MKIINRRQIPRKDSTVVRDKDSIWNGLSGCEIFTMYTSGDRCSAIISFQSSDMDSPFPSKFASLNIPVFGG